MEKIAGYISCFCNYLSIEISDFWCGAFTVAILFLAVFLWWHFKGGQRVEAVEFGFAGNKVSFKPSNEDQQLAYKIWVELSTRKLGLPIDLDHDVIVEIYDSWYAFFMVTRELIKDVPASKMSKTSTRKIVETSIEVLNLGLRPHLTTWQARFRGWYEPRLHEGLDVDPQETQRRYPRFDELSADLLEVNRKLIEYRDQIRKMF